MKNRKPFLVYIFLCLAIVLTSVATTLALVKDEHKTSDTSIKFDKVAIMGHEENGSNLELTLTSDYVGDGELVFNGSGEKDYLWIKPTSDTADMFLRFRVYFTLGSEELDEVNADTLALLNNGNGVPEGFKLYEDESLDYELIPYDGWVYVATINDEIIEVENKILKVVQNTTKQDRKYIISKEYRLDYDKENDEEAIFNMISLNDNQITLKVEAHAIQCFGLSNNIQGALEQTQNGNHLILDSNGQILEETYGNVTLKSYVQAQKENEDSEFKVKALADCTPAEIKKLGEMGSVNANNQWVVNGKVWFNIGDETSISLSNGETLTLQIAGFNHDVDENGEVIPFTFITKDLMDVKIKISNKSSISGGWPVSNGYSYLNGTVWGYVPQEWKEVITPTLKDSMYSGSSNSKIVQNVNNLFFLSSIEVGDFVNTQDYPSYYKEGKQYPIFTDNASRVKFPNKEMTDAERNEIRYWLRTPDSSYMYAYVHCGAGGYVTSCGTNYSWNICFGFCV